MQTSTKLFAVVLIAAVLLVGHGADAQSQPAGGVGAFFSAWAENIRQFFRGALFRRPSSTGSSSSSTDGSSSSSSSSSSSGGTVTVDGQEVSLADLQALQAQQTQAEQDFAAAVLSGQFQNLQSSGSSHQEPQVVYVTETITSFITNIDRNTAAPVTEYVTVTVGADCPQSDMAVIELLNKQLLPVDVHLVENTVGPSMNDQPYVVKRSLAIESSGRRL